MKKKNLLALAFMVVAVSTLPIQSCKKDLTRDTRPEAGVIPSKTLNRTISPTHLITKITEFLEVKKLESEKKNEVIESLLQHTSFNNYSVHNLNEEADLVIMPINAEFQTSNYQNAENNLVFVFDKDGEIAKCNIIQFVSNSPLADGSLVELFKTAPSQNGRYVFLNLADILISDKTFKDGTLTRYSQRQSSTEDPLSNCFTLWLVHTDIYTDRIEQTWDLLGTFCEAGDQTDPGSGSGGYHPTDPDEQSKAVDWEVGRHSMNFWYVQSYEVLFGVKVPTEPGGGHFTKGIHENSSIFNLVTNPNSQPGNPLPFATYQEMSNNIALLNEWATVTTSGKVTQYDFKDFPVKRSQPYGVWQILQ